MADNGPIEIKLTLDKDAVKRDLDRMKAAAKKDSPQMQSGGLKTDLKSPSGSTSSGGLGGGNRMIDSPAFPSGVGTGSGRVSVELPKLVQKEIGKMIGKATPKIVETEVKSILPKLLKSFASGGFGGAAKFAAGEAASAAGGAEGIAGLVGGEGAAGAVGAVGGALGAVVTYAGVAALVAYGMKKTLDEFAAGADFGSLVFAAISAKFPGASGIFAKFNEWSDELHEVKANLDTLLKSASRTIGLEESRLLIGGETQTVNDFSRIHDLQVRKQREEAASERQNKNDMVRGLVRQLAEGAK